MTPAGELAEASETETPDLLRMVGSSYGLCGIVYEVTFRVKPIEALHFGYLPRPLDELIQAEVDNLLDRSEGLICWTVAHLGHFIDQLVKDRALRDKLQNLDFDTVNVLYSLLNGVGGITILAPDKIIDYCNTPPSARYVFTFLAFARAQWLTTLRAYLNLADEHFKTTGFRCNMPLGATSGRTPASVVHV